MQLLPRNRRDRVEANDDLATEASSDRSCSILGVRSAYRELVRRIRFPGRCRIPYDKRQRR